ncbi:MAG: STAS-like domain-containing protein, partial [Desulfobacula sp.]|nr:STAS-like domain-containing protein [Desulfobacula sp.]
NDERHAVLELSKGKLTTDPDNHTGEGIFFSSRMFDEYAILSGEVYFAHEYNKPEGWIIERENPGTGTTVFMKMSNNSARKTKTIFDNYTSGDDYCFDKTVVPVSLARYGNERLVSRSQAKRLLVGVERFKIVIFDFEGIDQIGQAFADEVFRVFNNRHPDIQLYFIKTKPDVENMILRALSSRTDASST